MAMPACQCSVLPARAMLPPAQRRASLLGRACSQEEQELQELPWD